MKLTSIAQVPTFQPQREQQDEQEEERMNTLERIVRKFYFVHLIACFILEMYLLIEESNYRVSLTYLLLGFYGFMLVWNWLVNFGLVICGLDSTAVFFNRVFIRFLIMIYLPLGIGTAFIDKFLNITLVAIYQLYLCVVSIAFIVYEIYGCTYGEPTNPRYIFEYNDLHVQTEKVWQQRRKYNKEVISNMEVSNYQEK